MWSKEVVASWLALVGALAAALLAAAPTTAPGGGEGQAVLARGLRRLPDHRVFVTIHSPAFARSGMGAIPEAQNPNEFLAPYAKDLEVVVFNGHVHTTDLFE